MNLISRYVLAELLKVFAISLAGLTILMLLVGVVRQAMSEGLSLKHVLLLIPYILPDALRFTLPATALFAASCVFGRMSGSNEIVALKASGISPLTILLPAYVFGFFLSLVTVWLNDVAVSWGRDGVRSVIINAVEDIAISRLQLSKRFSTKLFNVVVKEVDGRRLVEPTFTYHDKNRANPIILRCDSAWLESNGGKLKLRCYHGEASGEMEYLFPDQFECEFDLEDLRDDNVSYWSSGDKPMWRIQVLLDQHTEKVARLRQAGAVKAAMQLIAGDFDALADREWQTEERILDGEEYVYRRLVTELPRRWANGFSCLSFLIVGSAMAIRLRNAGALSSFFVCFLPILIVYYPLLVFSADQVKNGLFPPQMVWLGNVVLALWGVWLLRRVLRY